MRELTMQEQGTRTKSAEDYAAAAQETGAFDDRLLGQIDEFREKAMALQSLMAQRQTQVEELSAVMAEREGQAQRLASIVEQRQKRADGITTEFAARLDELIGQVDGKLEQMQRTLREDAREQETARARQDKQLSEAVDKLITQVGGISEQMEKLPDDVLDSVESELDDLSTEMDELSEKVHSESVQNYRNTADLVRELSVKVDRLEQLQQSVRSTKGVAIGALVFGILNLVVLIAGFAVNFLHIW